MIEGEDSAPARAAGVADDRAEAGVPFIFKWCFDKANRTSGKSFRGPG